MNDTWDDDDRAIAAALGADLPGDAGQPVDADAIADYENVVAYLPFEEVPPRDLEDRVVAAALARRPAAVRSLEPKRSTRDGARPRVMRSWVAAGVAAAAAAAIIVALAAGRTTTGSSAPGARIEPAVATSDLSRVRAERGSRRGIVRTPQLVAAGSVVLDPQGDGYLTDLRFDVPPASRLWLWLDTTKGPLRVGSIPGAPEVHFVVRGDLQAVRGVIVSSAPAGHTPAAPVPVLGRARLPG